MSDILFLPHGVQPTSNHLLSALALSGLMIATVFIAFRSLTPTQAQLAMKELGIKINKLKRTAQEIERKNFHLLGMIVPFMYGCSTRLLYLNEEQYARFCWVCTITIWVGDVLRICIPAVNKVFPYTLLNKILRDKEKTQLSGTCYFSLGATLVISLFPMSVATVSICFLVVGDMAAALFGIAFGGDACVIKMGRDGKKSLEGSVAMFVACCLIGFFLMNQVYLCEYVIFFGALAATIVELYEPFGLNDNLTIPFFSAMTMQIALKRIESCS